MAIMKLSHRAVLVSLHTGSWTGMLTDRKVTEEVSEANNADLRGAGRYGKQIVSNKFLHTVNSKVSQARRTHFALSLPWEDNGTRILATRGYKHYTEQMRLARIMVESAAKEFAAGMPTYIEEAKHRLGDMFNEDDYPSADVVRKKFYVDVEVNQVPESGDFRAKLSSDQVAAVVKDIEERTNSRVNRAVQSVFERIADLTSKMAEKLRDFEPATGKGKAGAPKSAFKATLVYNIQELAETLPALNITGDERLDKLQKELLDKLAAVPPEILRSDAKERKKVAADADEIFKKVSTYLA